MTTALQWGRDADTGVVVGVGVVALVGTISALLVNPVVVVAGLIAIVGAIAIVENPGFGALAIAAFAILRLSDVATDFHGAPSTFTPLLALILLALVARNIRTGERPSGGGRALVVIAALASVGFVSLLSTPDFDAGFNGLIDLVKDGAVAVMIGLLLRSSETLRQVVWVLLGGGIFLSALSIVQFLTDAYGSSFGGFAQSELQHVVGTTDEVRISGPIGDPNFYAQWLVMLVPLAIDRFHDEDSFPLRWIAAGAAAMSAAVIVITFSRGALLALVVVVGMMVLRHPPKLSTVVAVAAVGVLSLPFLPPGYVDRMVALSDIGGVDIGTDPSLRAREVEIAVGAQMFMDDPLTGIGYANYASSYQSYARTLGLERVAKPREAHNLYLETAAETGIPGVVVLGGVIIAVSVSLAEGRKRFRSMGNHRADGIGYAIGVALVGYLVTSVFLHLAFARPAFLLIGIALTFPALASTENKSRDRALQAGS
jgi:O-antigen ligase